MNLKMGYIVLGIATGLIIIFNFLITLPDGKLHIVFCSVGQGDATYVRFPNGRDLLIDGGPNDSVVSCLGRHMPFWDKTIDLVLLTHPENDHLNGLLSVISRYHVGSFVHSNIENATDGYSKLKELLGRHRIQERFVMRGDSISIGSAVLHVLWPSQDQLTRMNPRETVLGASTDHVNDGSVVFLLRYGSFDGFFPGDADIRVETQYVGTKLADESLELLKVPHHGSKTGMDAAYLDWLSPRTAVISVGKNSYGHPSSDVLQLLARSTSQVLRTDQQGDIEVISDGRTWSAKPSKKGNHLPP